MKFLDQTGVFPLKQTPSRKGAHPRFIVIHYSYTHSPLSTVKVLNNKGLSTHFEVDQQGTIHKYVDPKDRYTLHGKHFNRHSIGIDVTSTGSFSAAQIAATRKLVTYLCHRFGIPQVVAPDGVKFKSLAQITNAGYGILRHRNLRPTACPGNFPMDVLAEPLSGDEGGLKTWEMLALAAAGAAAVWLWTRRRKT